MSSSLLKMADAYPEGGGQEAQRDQDERSRAAILGLRIFLAVVSSFFFLFLIAFIARSQLGDWRPLTEPAAPLYRVEPLLLNTLVLMMGSLALQWARVVARHGRRLESFAGFLLGGFCALGFIAGQLWLWRTFVVLGYGFSVNPANSFFFLLTGLHGLHLLGGLVVWARTLWRYGCGLPLAQLSRSLALCAIYWHYLLALWLVLFVVLSSSPQTYQVIAAFCGLR
ncbi:cytochrome c oxidase subunit 3 [Marinobacterium rhizophilum]|uniref:Cytochrome c oxidase subunit 3 n=1 Tax=Marinobacterium rhizophilum TaxID=420402 RepID=A0ABY5HFS1_9GAMM|nr:cytochrome c oxidase subunit 3 [Marinobacterium rhizophilum]UTW10174.1 cytochrome c oxidase subunit 3 [Marinobacterium rhizophilum]